VDGWEEGGEVGEWVGGLTMLVDTANQVCAQWAKQMVTAALTIPQAEQMYIGTELDPKLPY